MAFPFIGRHHELKLLGKLLEKRVASLVVVKGRRRIGKSRLIEEFAKNHLFYHFSGTPPVASTTNETQLRDFAQQLSFQTGLPEVYADDWNKLFLLLAEKTKSGRVIILLDEITWLGSKDPEFLGKLKNAWDIYFKKNPELILILCGSVSTWIEKNILSSTGFLGRIAFTLTIEELPIKDCNEFWLMRGSYIAPYEKFKVLSVTGGIPRYLEQLTPTASSETNIKDLCFVKGGPLVNEFNAIFSDLFSRRSALYKKIVLALVQGPQEQKDIEKALQRTHSGIITQYLDDLVQAGFIRRDYTWHLATGEVSRLSHYRLSDNYLRFYLKYIDPVLPKIQNKEFEFKSLSALPGWPTIMGFQMENLILNNRRLIKDRLGLGFDDVISDNPFFQRKTLKKAGCQIDYLIQSTFRCLFVCEMKFSSHMIGPEVITQVQQKIDRLDRPKSFSIRPVLIHINGVHEEVSQSGFFSHIIDFSEFLIYQPPDYQET
jgi:hypothetical protein